jgi:hypothetical protein
MKANYESEINTENKPFGTVQVMKLFQQSLRDLSLCFRIFGVNAVLILLVTLKNRPI